MDSGSEILYCLLVIARGNRAEQLLLPCDAVVGHAMSMNAVYDASTT